MDYQLAEKPPKHNGGQHYAHEVHFIMNVGRLAELTLFLSEAFGPQHNKWRFSWLHRLNHWERNIPGWQQGLKKCKVRFVHKDDAFRFKLGWNQCTIKADHLVNFAALRVADTLIGIQRTHHHLPSRLKVLKSR